MLDRVPVEKVLFLDIETVPQTYQFGQLEDKSRELFEMKTRFQQNAEKSFEQLYNERGGIFAEFGKILREWFSIMKRVQKHQNYSYSYSASNAFFKMISRNIQILQLKILTLIRLTVDGKYII